MAKSALRESGTAEAADAELAAAEADSLLASGSARPGAGDLDAGGLDVGADGDADADARAIARSPQAPSLPEGVDAASLLSSVLARTAQALAIVEAREPFRVIDASEGWCETSGHTLPELVGEPCQALLKLLAATGTPDGAPPRGSLSGRVLDRDARGKSFWSTVTVTQLAAQGLLLLQRDVGEDPDSPVDLATADLERYAHSARCGGDGLWDWNLVTGSVWYSPSLKELLGYAPDDAFPDTFEGLYAHMHDDHRMLVLRAVRRHLEQRHGFDLECQMKAAGGELRWFALSGAATRDPAGHPHRLSGSLRDITDRRRVQEVTRHAEDLQRRALDALHVAVGVLDGAGEIVDINRSWREFASDGGLIGMRYSFGEDYPALCERAAERCSEGPAAALGIRAVLEGKRASFSLTYRLETEEGERYYELRAQPFVDGDSRGAFVIHMDVSETREAYAQLAASRDFYELLLDAIPIQISYVSREQRIRYLNRSYEHWFQLPLSVVRGRRISELTGPERYRDIQPRIDAVLGGRDVEFEVRSARADGVERDLAVNYVANRGPEGDVVGFLSIVRDVTEQKRLEATLRHSQKMEAIGQLTGGIAHDFNNLLSVIIGNLQLLERPLAENERLAKQVQTALRAALRGAELTRRLLAFARQTVLEPRAVNMNTVLQGMNELLRRSLGREVEIHNVLVAEPWTVRADPGQLENCILNLSINARDAMPRGGSLTIETANVSVDAETARRHPTLRTGEYLVVSVSDTGSGMPPEVAKRAFEPFFTTKEVGKGTGLGLSMVYGFLEQSGGTATLSSELGQGTTVRLYFPRVDAPAPLPRREAEVAGASPPGGTERILVVEDDPDVRTTACVSLRSLGYQVVEAENASAALELLRQDQRIDLLFTDVTLPGGVYGPDLAQRARDLRPALKVLFTSGFSETTVIHRGMLDGTLPLISKPYAIAELARRLRAIFKPG